MSIEPEKVDYNAYAYNKNEEKRRQARGRDRQKGDRAERLGQAERVSVKDDKMEDLTTSEGYEHKIIDERKVKKSKKTMRSKKQNIYKKKTGKNANGAFKFVVLLLLVAILLLVSICIVGYNEKVSEVSAGQNGSKKYYGVEMFSSLDFNTAHVFADTLRRQGGGGFVTKKEGLYYVLATCYETEEDAKKVIEKLVKEGNQAKLHTLIVPFYPIRDYGLNNNLNYDECMTYADMVYRNLFELSNDLDLRKISENDAINKIKIVMERVKEMRKKLDLFEIKKQDVRIAKLKIELDIAVGVLDNLTNDNLTRPNLLCDIRYSYLLIINNYINLVGGFAV